MIAAEQVDDEEIDGEFKFRLRRDTIRSIRPPREERTWDIVSKDIRSHKNEPFSSNDYPWTEGICDAADDPNIRTIVLQFAARIGKTVLAQSLMIAMNSKSPATSMFGSSTEQLVKETIKNKYYPMFEKCKRTRKWVPPKSKRLQSRMDLTQMTMYTAWSGSYSTLADKDPRYKHAGEIDKWDASKSTEADPLELFMERGIEIPDRKSILESTPGIEGRSRINNYLTIGTNCRFQVPCPHKTCGHFQELVLGDGTVGGIIFDKAKDGSLDPNIAYNTARYQCEKCGREIQEHQRRGMIRRGKWCPEGQFLTKTGRLRGQKTRDSEVASFQLSRIYAPTFSFGDIARQFVTCKLKQDAGNDELMRNFYNSWLGLTWTPRRLVTTWEVLGPKLAALDYKMGMIPKGCCFATMGVDVQVDHYVYVKIAWDYRQAGFVYGYGICHNESDLVNEIETPGIMEVDGGEVEMFPRLTLMDARDGNRQDEVIELCRKMNKPTRSRWVWPSMGTRTSIMRGKSFTRNEVDGSDGLKNSRAKRKSLGFYWISVNANYWQQWIQNCLVKRKPGEPYSLALPAEAADDQDFLEQLLNEQPDKKMDSTGHDDTTVWVVVNEHISWDFRDAVRYARCAAEVHQNGNWRTLGPNRILNVIPAGGVTAVPEKQKRKTQKQPVRKGSIRSKRVGWIPKSRFKI